jgi:hypothetical protein
MEEKGVDYGWPRMGELPFGRRKKVKIKKLIQINSQHPA